MGTDDTDIGAGRTRALDRLGILLGARVQRDVELAAYTTYKVGGPARLFVKANSIDDLHAIANAMRETKVPVLVIGRGSNLLISDEGFEGLVVTLGDWAQEIIWPQHPGAPRVVVGAGVPLPILARQSVAHGLTGFEWGVGVPGSLGGAVRMNAGGHGSDIASSIESAKVFHLGKGIVASVSAKDLGLRFRASDLAPHHVVISATLALSWGDTAASEAEMAEIVRWRREHQPGGHNAGSVFVNPAPDGGSAGAIIDRLGLRGLRIGSAEVSTKHANFIQCDPGGSADDVVDLMIEVRERVLRESGVDLRSEIRLAGFDPDIARDAGAHAVELDLTSATRAVTPLDKLFGPLPGDDTLGTLATPVPLPDDAAVELRELFADTGAHARPDVTGDSTVDDAPSDDDVDDGSPVGGAVVDISVGAAVREAAAAANDEPVLINDDDHLLPFERTEGSAVSTIDPTSPFAQAAVSVADADDSLGSVIVDERIGRRSGWRRLRAIRVSPLAGFGILLGVFSLILVVLASPLFAVRRVEVQGATYTDPVLLQSVTESLRGASVFTVDLDGATRRLEGDPWVQRARLDWYLPNRVVVEIQERRPVAWFVGVDNRARVLDFDGRVLAVLEGQPTQFMRIEGVGPNLPPGSVATLVYQAAAQLAVSFPESLASLVRHVDVKGPDKLGFTLKTGTVVTLGTPVDVRNKLIQVVTIVNRQDPALISAIDVSGGQPIVQVG